MKNLNLLISKGRKASCERYKYCKGSSIQT